MNVSASRLLHHRSLSKVTPVAVADVIATAANAVAYKC